MLPRHTPSTLILLGASLLLSSGLFAADSGPRRDGEFWVETSTGSLATGDAEQLKITLVGDVVIHTGATPQVEYRLIRRVRVRSLAEARDALQNAETSLARHGRYLRLSVDGDTGPVSLQVTVPRSLAAVGVGTGTGSIEIDDFDGSFIAQSGGGDARIGRVKGNLDLSTGGGTLHIGEVGGWARVTSGGGDITAESIHGEASFQTLGGDITVRKAGGAIRAVTGGGKVRIEQAAGAVVASNGGGGAIDIGRAGGMVSARNTGGGPILIGSAAGIQCESASGVIRAASSSVMRIVTASGNVVAQFQGETLSSDSFISTGSGDVTVFLPSKLRVSIQAQNAGATRREGILSEFSSIRAAIAGGAAIASGSLNGGGPLLRIQGTSGTIWIRKK